MNKPKNYDETQVFSGSKQLPSGGYICRILDVKETVSRSGKDMLVISLDIAEGEYKFFYSEKYKADTRKDKKWGCTVYQLVLDGDGNCNKGLKGFLTSVEESNDGYSVVWGDGFCSSLKNKLVGGLFGKEEFMTTDGKKASSTKCRFFRSVDTIKNGEYEVPEDKLLETTKETNSNQFYAVEENVNEDDLPF